ncbi:DUF6896 domain-containing protein [Streptomyces sp. NPDC059431]|uniref:DUF6896 domain-containing protein n=2 Tax=Streptomyces TaxID=1883 RepID=UPI0036C5A12A
MMSNASAEVTEYVETLARVQAEVLRSLPDLGSSLAAIVRRVRTGQLSKSGSISGGIEYAVHGDGCLFVSSDGQEIDIDFLIDGTPVFDSWRIERFSASRGIASKVTGDELTQECRLMASSGTLEEVSEGWFSVKPEQSTDGRLIGDSQG